MKKDVTDLKDYKSPFFYGQNGAMVFKMKGDGARSELRFLNEWSVATTRTRRMVGRLSLPRPSSGMEQFTWMQVHGGSEGKKPLLRLSWNRERLQDGKQLSNVLLATVRLNNRSGTSRRGAGGWRGAPLGGGPRRSAMGWCGRGAGGIVLRGGPCPPGGPARLWLG